MKYKLFLLLLIILTILFPVLAHQGEDHGIELPQGLQKIIDSQKERAQNLTFLAVFLAGIVTITSPCGVVIIPMFIAFTFKNRKKALLMASAFSLGITIAFIILGIIASLLGNFFNPYKQFFALISGIAIIIFAVMTLLNKGFSFFTFKIKPNNKKGFFAYILFGVFFAGAWTPCIGPVLSSIFFLAANMGSAIKSVFLLVIYSFGIIIPFIIFSVLSDKYDFAKYIQGKTRTITIFGKKIQTTIYNIVSAILLFIIGIIILIYKGTYTFESIIQTNTPWSMDILLKVNDYIINSAFMKTLTANIIGIMLILIIAIFVVLKIRKDNS